MLKHVTAIVCGTVLYAAAASAQMGTGRVTGSLQDTQGNPIVGGTVTATSADGDRTLEATTDDDGRWAILGFRSGSWEFSFTAPGFAPQAYTNNVRQTGRNPPMDVVLERVQQGQAGGGEASGLLGEANALYEAKDYEGAIAKYQEILASEPTLYQVNYNIGSAQRALGQLDEALASYQKVLEMDPMHTASMVSMGDVYVEKGELDQAVSYFEKAIGQTQDEIIPFNVAEIYMSRGDAAKALEFYQIAAERKPDWAEVHLKIAYAHLNTGDMAAARTAFEKVVEVAPDSAQAQMAQQALAALPQ